MKRLLAFMIAVFAALSLAQGGPELHFVHLVEGVGAVDVWVNGRKAFGVEGFKNFTEYLPVSKGSVRVWVNLRAKPPPGWAAAR